LIVERGFVRNSSRTALNLGAVNYISAGDEATAGRLVRLTVNYFARPILGLVASRPAFGGPNWLPANLSHGNAVLEWLTTDFEVNKKAPRLREGLFHLLGAWR
jgi:hypothetical protein